MDKFHIKGKLVNIDKREIQASELCIENGKIIDIKPLNEQVNNYILPGFIDSHIHIESSMLVPTEFARIAVLHGTVATISDPHEIANVCGIPGIKYMLDNAAQSPLKFNFGAPPCVPATDYETSGARLNPDDIETLLSDERINYLAEMMNFPGVLHSDPDVMRKISIARAMNLPIDGHAPGLKGKAAAQYASAGISTDHECFTAEEALDKIAAGMKILIREGSAAKNFDALIPLLKSQPDRIMFCSDDKHPDDLIEGHINQLVERAVDAGCDLFDTLYAACIHPIEHYGIDVGRLRIGDSADFILCEDLKTFAVKATYIDGIQVAESGKCLVNTPPVQAINNFHSKVLVPGDFKLSMDDNSSRQMSDVDSIDVHVIEALDKQLITGNIRANLPLIKGEILPDIDKDILKIGVVNRYVQHPEIAIGFVKNFGLGKAAIASSVAHDSHNIVFVGSDDDNICNAVNALIEQKGGISICSEKILESLSLPIAGLMSDKPGNEVARQYKKLNRIAKELGSALTAPFMTLSFMALPVIPSLKITDKGLFDVEAFHGIELFAEEA